MADFIAQHQAALSLVILAATFLAFLLERFPPAVVAVAGADPRLTTAGTAGMVPLVDKPIPVRTPAQVMRVWLAPWEDERGVFHVGGYSFIEVEARRWTLGEPAVAEPVRFFSIQDAAAESEEPAGEGPSVREERSGTARNR